MAGTTRRTAVIGRLRELMAALDRRRPQNGQGESAIVRDAAALRSAAAARMEAMERDDAPQAAEDDDVATSPREME